MESLLSLLRLPCSTTRDTSSLRTGWQKILFCLVIILASQKLAKLGTDFLSTPDNWKNFLLYSQRLTQYWPEFKDNGKEVLFPNHRILFDRQAFFAKLILIQGITVADLLRHEAGFANFPTRWQLDCPPILCFRICLGTVG